MKRPLIFCLFASFFLSTCLCSKPLLARGQRALRAYNDIGEWLFVQARQPFANIVKLLCSYLCPFSLGAFVLLLRSLVEEIGIIFYLFAMSFEVRGRCETPSYFLSICEFLPFNLLMQQASARSWAKGSASL